VERSNDTFQFQKKCTTLNENKPSFEVQLKFVLEVKRRNGDKWSLRLGFQYPTRINHNP